MTLNIAIIILGGLILDFALDLTANLLNLKASGQAVPPFLQGIYPPEAYRRSQQYLRAHTVLGLVRGGSSLLLLLGFWLYGGFGWLDAVVRGWQFPAPVTGLCYAGILFLAYGLLTLPFSIYDTFVIEQRFGFNRTGLRLFITDRVKGLLLSLLLGAPFLVGALALFQSGGRYAWLYAWAGVTAVVITAQYVVPAWILPLFNKFTPMAPGELKNAIQDYARAANFPLKNVYVMDGSRRSTKSNAFFTGFGRNKRIALFDTLVERFTTPEIVSILAHEIGHYRKKHILTGTVISILHAGVLLFLFSRLLDNPDLYRAFGVAQPAVYTGLLFFILLVTPLELLVSVGMQALSRQHEQEADRFTTQTIGNPVVFGDALKKLAGINLSNLTPHPFYVCLRYSHPPLLQRLRTTRRNNPAG